MAEVDKVIESGTVEEIQECTEDVTKGEKKTVWCLPCSSTGELHPASRYRNVPKFADRQVWGSAV